MQVQFTLTFFYTSKSSYQKTERSFLVPPNGNFRENLIKTSRSLNLLHAIEENKIGIAPFALVSSKSKAEIIL